MRVLAFAALVGAVQAVTKITSGDKCGVATSGDSDLCGIPQIAAAVADAVDAQTAQCGVTSGESYTCAGTCWDCWSGSGLQTMTADNTNEQKTLAAGLTVMKSDAFAACAETCFGTTGAADGPIAITTAGFDFPEAGVTLGEPNWCGLWADRETTETCSTSIFDAKGLLFLVIIGGALAIIFFQCSIMAVVAAVRSGDDDDAKP